MEKIRMHYGRYKKHYPDCQTVAGSYDKYSRTIEVIIPEGRMKKNGVRGQQFYSFEFEFTNEEGTFKACYKAVSKENAIKRLIRDFKPINYEIIHRY